jgi:hypothetical protein
VAWYSISPGGQTASQTSEVSSVFGQPFVGRAVSNSLGITTGYYAVFTDIAGFAFTTPSPIGGVVTMRDGITLGRHPIVGRDVGTIVLRAIGFVAVLFAVAAIAVGRRRWRKTHA